MPSYDDYRVPCPKEQVCKCYAVNIATEHAGKIIDFQYNASYPKVNRAIDAQFPNAHSFIVAADPGDNVLSDGLQWNNTTRILYFLPQSKPTRFAVWVKAENSNASCGGWEWQAQDLCLVLQEIPCNEVILT